MFPFRLQTQVFLRVNGHKQNLIQAVRGLRLAFRVQHFLGVAVVSGQKYPPAAFQHRVHDTAHAGVHSFTRFDHSRYFSRMADHIQIGQITNA